MVKSELERDPGISVSWTTFPLPAWNGLATAWTHDCVLSRNPSVKREGLTAVKMRPDLCGDPSLPPDLRPSLRMTNNCGGAGRSRFLGAYPAFQLTSRSIEIRVLFMRTTLDIPESLIEEARLLLGFKSKTDTVVVSLQELIRRKRIDELKAMMGNVQLEFDAPKSRRRTRS